MKVMVVAPHPDDAEISCAGTLAQWIRDGQEVVYVICTNGEKGSDDHETTPEELRWIRHREQEAAALVLGVKEIIFLGHPDGALEDNYRFRGQIVREFRFHRPDLVLTCDPYHRYTQHRDHRITGLATLDAAFPYARDHLFYPEHLAEGLQPYKVRELYLWGTEQPDVFIDISDTFETKLAALSCHRSQLQSRSREEFEECVREYSAYLGKPRGLSLAETFHRVELRG